ncbi:hypothetical protein Sste5346_008024 [Sporothrix stenoceras]|uniref:Uncharacterized protein n=1 Tax=Sporothrix stenoceras TaxID=5173 RepID=A0ABR3YRG0_9PEZI
MAQWLDQPRKRTLPLVPDAFPNIMVYASLRRLPGSDICDDYESAAETYCRFFPTLNIPQYVSTLTDEDKAWLDKRANRLANRAIDNELSKVSEFCWEVCAWNDVFGRILDDQSLLIDKRQYEYVEVTDKTDETGKVEKTVRVCIPDATMGLRTYNAAELKKGFNCTMPDCRDDHRLKTPDVRLARQRLLDMVRHPDCGLLVDGRWGCADLVFPFAVYEAKKNPEDHDKAEEQVHDACRTYLALLDDLARDPTTNLATYQGYEEEDPSETIRPVKPPKNPRKTDLPLYQMFAFTSSGPHWRVFVAGSLSFFSPCAIEPIWTGDVRDFRSAHKLLCLVDQIHAYAERQHRNFVMQHLHAWYVWYRAQVMDNKVVVDTKMMDDTDDEAGNNGNDCNNSNQISKDHAQDLEKIVGGKEFMKEVRTPEWLSLQHDTKYARQIQAFQTRHKKRKTTN